MALALAVGILVAGGVFMILRRGMMRIVVGFAMLSHGVNLLIVTAGGPARRRAAIGEGFDLSQVADPLPQAFVLTAIVISFAVTIYMLVLAVIGDGDDDTRFEVAGREMETAELLPFDPRHPPREPDEEGWHAYLDRTDDLPGDDAGDEDDLEQEDDA